MCLQAGTGKPSDSTEFVTIKAPLVGDAPEVLHPLEDLVIVSPASVVLECDLQFGEPLSEIEW